MSGATKGCLIALAVAVGIAVLIALAFIFVIGRAADELDETFDEIEQEFDENTGIADADDYDIELTACIAEPGRAPVAEGTLTNRSDQDRAFTVTASFSTDDIRLESSFSYIDRLDQDATTAWRVSSFTPLPSDLDPADVTCTIESVEYSF